MIPVKLAPEPATFDSKVRQRGRTWLSNKKIPLNQPPPTASKLPRYWSATQKELWKAYNGTCAYLAIFFEWPTGASSTDHFIAKSENAGEAYEWSNYRLSCLGANRSKNKFDDILDPFQLQLDTFTLNLLSGKISPNKQLSTSDTLLAKETIARLHLNDGETKEMRARHYSEYLDLKAVGGGGVTLQMKLKKYSPFVWYEAKRQGLL